MNDYKSIIKAFKFSALSLKRIKGHRYLIFVGQVEYDKFKQAARDKKAGFKRRGRYFYFGGCRVVLMKPYNMAA